MMKLNAADNPQVWAFPGGETSTSYAAVQLDHPVTKKTRSFLLSARHELFVAEELKDETYSTLLVQEQDASDALALGQSNTIHVAAPFSAVWFLIAQLEPALDSKRMLSMEDLVDTLTDANESLAKLAEMGVELGPLLQECCESFEEGDETFLRPSAAKITAFITRRLQNVAEHLPASLVAVLSRELDNPDETVMAAARMEQARVVLQQYASEALVARAFSSVDLAPLRAALAAQAQMELLEQAKRASAEDGSGAGLATKKQKPAAKPAAAKKVKVGALDRFFAKKK